MQSDGRRRPGRHGRGRAAFRVPPGAPSVVQADVAGGQRALRREGLQRASAPWRLAAPMPDAAASRAVEACTPGRGPKVVFSALDASVAGEIEERLRRGRAHRRQQRAQLPHGPAGAAPDPGGQRRPSAAPRASSGRRRAGPAPSSPTRIAPRSCSRWRWRRSGRSASRAVVVSTMQAVSGAGYPGVPSLDILGNVVPFIGGEEEKMRDARR